MTQEEKAKAYDEAIKRAKAILKVTDNMRESLLYVSTIFPELKESEDERIRKAISQCVEDMRGQFEKLYSVHHKDAIAWLEKQGEMSQGKSAVEAAKEEKIDIAIMKSPEESLGISSEEYNKIVDECIYGEQKPTQSNVEKEIDNVARLWTIQDAKDGDVLVNGSNIFIFHFLNDTRLMAYCHANIDNGRFYDDLGKNECFCLIDAVVMPATKEQRDLLFQKMKEAGYEWDAEKKELKKVEKKPTWSEEDERNLQGIIDEIKANKNHAPHYDLATYDRFLSWLNSIKDRYTWKPSDEQMIALRQAYSKCSECPKWGCPQRNYATNECVYEKYYTKNNYK